MQFVLIGEQLKKFGQIDLYWDAPLLDRLIPFLYKEYNFKVEVSPILRLSQKSREVLLGMREDAGSSIVETEVVGYRLRKTNIID